MDADRTELTNLASQKPGRVQQMAALYESWAKRCDVLPPDQLPAPRATVPAKVSRPTAAAAGSSSESSE